MIQHNPDGEACRLVQVDQTGQLPLQEVSFPNSRVMVCSIANPESDGPNEDSAAVIMAPSGQLLLIVADGAGGSRQGHVASKIAVNRMVEAVLAADPETASLRALIIDSMEHSNQEILDLGTGAGTTLMVAEIHDGQLRTYHAGDSTVLVCSSRGNTRLMTVGHNITERAVEAGWMDANEAIVHEERHLVSNILGTPELRIEIGSRLKLSPLDTVLVASDGLFDNLVPDEVISGIRKEPLNQNFAKLVRKTQRMMTDGNGDRHGKPDDLTIIAWKRSRAAKGELSRRTFPASLFRLQGRRSILTGAFPQQIGQASQARFHR